MVAFLILLLFAVIFLVAGGVLLYFRNRTKQKSALMNQTETSSASGVSGLAPGTLVEVKGRLRCEEPLIKRDGRKDLRLLLVYGHARVHGAGRRCDSTRARARCSVIDDNGRVEPAPGGGRPERAVRPVRSG